MPKKSYIIQSNHFEHLLYLKFKNFELAFPDDHQNGACEGYFVQIANGVLDDDARFVSEICNTDIMPGFYSDDISMTVFFNDKDRVDK